MQNNLHHHETTMQIASKNKNKIKKRRTKT